MLTLSGIYPYNILLLSLFLLLSLCNSTYHNDYGSKTTINIVQFLKNYTRLAEVIDINSVDNQIRDEKETATFNWIENKKIVENAGHPYCGT
jgi:hypothetical protein